MCKEVDSGFSVEHGLQELRQELEKLGNYWGVQAGKFGGWTEVVQMETGRKELNIEIRYRGIQVYPSKLLYIRMDKEHHVLKWLD